MLGWRGRRLMEGWRVNGFRISSANSFRSGSFRKGSLKLCEYFSKYPTAFRGDCPSSVPHIFCCLTTAFTQLLTACTVYRIHSIVRIKQSADKSETSPDYLQDDFTAWDYLIIV